MVTSSVVLATKLVADAVEEAVESSSVMSSAVVTTGEVFCFRAFVVVKIEAGSVVLSFLIVSAENTDFEISLVGAFVMVEITAVEVSCAAAFVMVEASPDVEKVAKIFVGDSVVFIAVENFFVGILVTVAVSLRVVVVAVRL